MLIASHTLVCEQMIFVLPVCRSPLFCLCGRRPLFCLWADDCVEKTTLLSVCRKPHLRLSVRWPHFKLWANDHTFVHVQKTTPLHVWQITIILSMCRTPVCVSGDHTLICEQITRILSVVYLQNTTLLSLCRWSHFSLFGRWMAVEDSFR